MWLQANWGESKQLQAQCYFPAYVLALPNAGQWQCREAVACKHKDLQLPIALG